ncbi:isoprenoid synthase domain-containing protein [Armillaria borealis]|uniref:(2E,6E)-farnesyl diphosphate synthase n=1 Tax=Armillaria borealis TaxID=47425 RepID=A0AA39IX49_9AGAR|nr:isoprenoid synthase domain-containing protein [Armillaria borealis]
MSTDKAARRARFEGAWKVIKQELLDYITGEGMPKDAIEWYERNLDYNIPGGKLNRGMSVVDTAEIIKGTPLTDDEYLKAALLQAFFLVSDDMMDSSITRRGPALLAIYYLLKKHFRGETYYVDVLELFLETTFQTEMGQLIDLITAPEDEVDLSKFSLKKHSLIVIYKTAYYSFYLPVALAMYISKTTFLDFSGTPEQIGKIGTDILDNKCSWCVNTALAACTPKQRRVLDENHGRKDSECERRVKEVFESPEVDLRKRYGMYEEKVYGELVAMIGEILEVEGKSTLKREVFKSFLDKIYKRTK